MDSPAFLGKNKQLLVRIVIALGVFLALVSGFVAIADEVGEGDTLPYDEAILTSINSLSSPGLDAAVVLLTEMGGVVVVTAATLLLTMYLLYKRQRYQALFVVAAMGGSTALNIILKLIFERTRPDLWTQLVTETSFSFPSGHAMASSALAACVAVLLWNTKWRVVGVIGGVLYTLIIAFTRLYLGVHYPTDILGGWLMGVSWVLVVAGLIYVRRHRLAHSSNENVS